MHIENIIYLIEHIYIYIYILYMNIYIYIYIYIIYEYIYIYIYIYILYSKLIYIFCINYEIKIKYAIQYSNTKCNLMII